MNSTLNAANIRALHGMGFPVERIQTYTQLPRTHIEFLISNKWAEHEDKPETFEEWGRRVAQNITGSPEEPTAI
ncbi:MAG: hypothetical protein WCD79_03765 [Chthoniobacteraceae bacterium]